MKLIDIIPNSTLSFIATITGPESLEKLEVFLGANLKVIKEFVSVQLHINYTDGVKDSIIQDYFKIFRKYVVPRPVYTFVYTVNRGHMFGTIDLDESCFSNCSTEYLWKANDDMLLSEKLFDVEVPADFDFAYLPGFSYETLLNAGSTANLMKEYESSWYAPQSTFFIIRRKAVDNLYGNDVEYKRGIYLAAKARNPSLKPWDILFPDGLKFGCEDHLGRTTKGLNRKMLLSEAGFKKLIDYVKYHADGDPSHKDVMLEEIGVCHYHNCKTNNKVYIA